VLAHNGGVLRHEETSSFEGRSWAMSAALAGFEADSRFVFQALQRTGT